MKALLVVLILAAAASAQKMEECQGMPARTPARTHCFQAAQAKLDAEKKAVTYTVTLYGCSGEIQHWQARDLSFLNGGLEFNDVPSQHRIHLEGSYTIESTSDRMYSTDDPEEEDAH